MAAAPQRAHVAVAEGMHTRGTGRPRPAQGQVRKRRGGGRLAGAEELAELRGAEAVVAAAFTVHTGAQTWAPAGDRLGVHPGGQCAA